MLRALFCVHSDQAGLLAFAVVVHEPRCGVGGRCGDGEGFSPADRYRENGVLPNVDTELSPQSQLAAAELIELYTTAPTEKEAND
jgi:hypothetical protein